MHEMGLATIYSYMKLDISSYTRSRFTEGGLKFNGFAPVPGPRPFVGILLRLGWDLPRSIRIPNLKFLASPILNLGKGFKIWPWTLITPFLGYFVTRKMRLAKIYPYTKFEVSSFT